MSRTLTKIGVQWNNHPESFECMLERSEEDGNIIWRLHTSFDILTQEGELIHQHETWVLPNTAVTTTENIRTRVTNRIKSRNSIP